MTIQPTGPLADAIHSCVESVVRDGRHVSAAIEAMFRSVRPMGSEAATIRNAVYDAIRYNDVKGAIQRVYRNVADPDRAVIPAALRQLVEEAYGSTTPAILKTFLLDAPTFVRVNTLRCTNADCMEALKPFSAVHVEHNVLRVDAPYGMFTSTAFNTGWFEQQDITSQRAGRELAARAGERIVDACAGAGGKTLLFAAEMRNRGRIIALDTSEQRLQALRSRLARSGADIVEPRLITTTKVVKRLASQADGVFVDVPCTGTGVFRRNPDMIARFTLETYQALLTQQADILRRNALVVKPGGRLVYATCSILPGEGTDQIRNFLASETGAHFTLRNEWQTQSGENGGDGFYVATLTRSSAS